VYLTTPIYYVNGVPHVGHAYATVLADALVRWERLRGRPARLVTGTDEHGANVVRAAAAAGLPPAEYADATAARFRHTWDRLGIGYDAFVRTTSAEHRAVVLDLLRTVYDAGYVEPGVYNGQYCYPCEAYVSEPVCPVHRRPTEHLAEENYFFRLSAFSERLGSWLAQPDVVRPASRRNEALGWLRAGLVDFSISRRSVAWGIPLPWDPKHVAYVWFDALGAYVTGAGSGPVAGSGWWPGEHLIGKDILRFHAIYWPAILLAAGLAPPRRITVHGFLLAQGEKIAKSGVRGASLDDLLARFGPDGLRYHLLRSYPVGPDGDFSVAAATARYHADLANTLGNLVSRLTALVVSRCGGTAPAPDPASPLRSAADRAVDTAGAAWDDRRPSDALAAVWRLVAATNGYLVAAEPWHLDAGPALDRTLGDCLAALRLVTVLSSPAIPSAAAEILRRIGTADAASLDWSSAVGGTRVARGTPLFPRLSPVW